MIPGLRTLKNFLITAAAPVGSTMYIYGGGWNEADDGAGEEAMAIGLSPRWQQFFEEQGEDYDFRRFTCRHDGLDCSGYVGWVLYNTVWREGGHEGYVLPSRQMAGTFAARGWGSYRPAGEVRDYRPGDIMSSAKGHVYIVVGQCADGSLVLLHSSPPGVMLTGTATITGNMDSAAVSLAKYYLKAHYPDWYRKYPDCGRDASYLTDYDQMRWDLSALLRDPDGFAALSPPLLLANIFK